MTIATVQTLFQRGFPVEWWRQFGMTILDEAHHAGAKSFDSVLANSTARYHFGFSASETRADGMEPLIRLSIGPAIHKLELKSKVPVTVHKINSDFTARYNPSGPIWLKRKNWHTLIEKLISDEARNKLIADKVEAELANGRSVLVLSRRIEHLQRLQALISADTEVVSATTVAKPERRRIIQAFRDGEVKCLLATQLADEGLDVPILSAVFLVFPARHKDKLLQQVGRALRESPGKTDAVIYDVVDEKVKTLWRQWHDRRTAYKSWGFTIYGKRAAILQSLRRKGSPTFGRIR